MAAFDFEQLTLGEVAAIENLSGLSIATIADDESPKGNAFAAMVMVMKRRTGEPTFTFNQALAVPLAEANRLLAPDSDEDDDTVGKDAPYVESETE